MRMKYTLYTLPLVFLLGSGPSEQFPQAEITNGLIRARIYLPDSEKGYYRGARFDWSGVIPELEYDGHTYFGQWFPEYSPTLHDAIMGPVEDFSAVGYDEAKTGDTFLKIGIGMLTKPDEPKYFFANDYQIVNAGTWTVNKKPDQVDFTHVLDDKDYAYEYRKTVALVKGKAEMALSHSLKNTGKKSIESMVYNHNFFVMDRQTVGPDFVTKFPFNLSGEARKTAAHGKIEDNRILFNKELANQEFLHFQSLEGFGDEAKDYDIKIENHKTGAAVRITSDRALAKLAFWSTATTLCPEPFILVKVDPGETFTWKINYQFYTCDITSK